MYKLIFILLAILAIGGGLMVGALNADPVNLDLLWVQLDWPLGLVLVVGFALGVLLGVALTWLLQVWPARLALRRAEATSRRRAGPADDLDA